MTDPLIREANRELLLKEHQKSKERLNDSALDFLLLLQARDVGEPTEDLRALCKNILASTDTTQRLLLIDQFRAKYPDFMERLKEIS